MCWEKEIEFIEEKKLRDLQLERLKATIKNAEKTEYYKHKFKELKIDTNIETLADLKKFPFTTKDDLRKAYPTGFLAVDKKDLVRLHSSSGTTGIPTVIYWTKSDLERDTNIVARSLYMAGVRSTDVFQNMMSYGLFTGGLCLHYGAEKIGCLVIPIGAGNTARQIKFIMDFGVTVLHITPSYALHLINELVKMGIEPGSTTVKRLILGAEPYSDFTKKRIEEMMKVEAYDCYGLSEMNGPAVAFQCPEREGLHLWEDYYIAEIINPVTGEEVSNGEEGELVLTILVREAMPLIRYKTKDIVYKYKEKCKCGRTHTRISRIKGRTDDMFIVSGVNVYPSQIEQVIMRIPEVGNNYQIILKREDHLDRLYLKIELNPKFFTGNLKEVNAIREKIIHALRNEILITPRVELVSAGSLPESTGKAKRVFDEREI